MRRSLPQADVSRRFGALAVLAAATWCASARGDDLPPAANRAIDFVADVQPIFTERCVSCHGPEKQRSDYRLDRWRDAVEGGSVGGAIVPGDSAASKLIHYVAGTDLDIEMPPKGERLTAEQIGVLRAWIDQGANWPAAAQAPEEKPLWSIQPLHRSDVPSPRHADWVRTPIDAFILAKLEAAGMTPAPPADKRTLIRRVYFNLIGLPPTPEQVEAFVHDARPDAYERMVDELLAGPRYGERWARHWLDVVHFAETHGHDEDAERRNAWPYRDYVIDAFNRDKPYARFIEEQIAGDALRPEDPTGVVAVAMLAAGPWDQSSQMGIQDGTIDKKIAQYLDRDDMIATVIGTFNSVTIHCARCHDHKFDPISQKDYYALQAVFAGVDRADRAFDADPAVHARRQSLLGEKAAIDEGRVGRDVLLGEAAQGAVAAWERSLDGQGVRWATLTPTEATSANGSSLTVQPDGSVLSGGDRPATDVYTLKATVRNRTVTAIRLEVMADDSLPHRGPGRQDNGNLHLSRVTITAGGRPVAIRHASADFDQQGWTIQHAIDANDKTAWGIYPKVGESHLAVFELAEPIHCGDEAGVEVVVQLHQLHGGGHLIGRPRLSVTDAAPPVRAAPMDPSIADLLAVPAAERSDEQRAALALHVMKQRVEHELAALPTPSMVYAVTDRFPPDGNFKPAGAPREVHMLRRGDIHQPVEPAAPGSLSCVAGLEPRFDIADAGNEAARRAALAKWVAHRDNVLTWRSIVNRVWHYHFGTGIADTPNDLGRMGGQPSHPELLDWLAVTFRDDMGGSLKQLHRLIVTSSVYRQASRHDERFAEIDADNRLLWRSPRLRLDAEQARDAVVMFTGKLDLTMGGPSVKQFIESKGVHVTMNADYTGFDPDHPNQYRRAIYRFVFRTVPDPLMDALDCPDLSQHAPKRAASVTAQQALTLLNNRFMTRLYEHVAARLAAAGDDPANRVRLLYELAMSRPPSDEELRDLTEYAAAHGWANAVRVVLNSNAFMFVD